MKMSPIRSRDHASRAFALVATLLVLAALIVMALGLLVLGSLERRTARAYSEKYRVELALEAAERAAQASLQAVLKRDDFWLVSREIDAEGGAVSSLTYLVYQDEGGAWVYVPLAGGLPRDQGGGGIPTLPTAPSGLENLVDHSENSLESQPVGRWELFDERGVDGRRLQFSFWLEDLQSRIDADLAGTDPRSQGLSPRESGFFTLFDPSAIREPAEGPHAEIVSNRELLQRIRDFSAVLDDQSAGEGPSTADVANRYLAFGVPITLVERECVPPYDDVENPGLPKGDLNSWVEAGDVESIAEKIRTHLPDFEKRRGGMAEDQNYLRTLAASIIDYADEDFNATLGPDFRGVDSYPFVNEIFDRYEWIAPPRGQNGIVRVQVRTFIELWNPSNKEIRGTIQLENVNRHRIIIPGLGEREFGSVTYKPQVVALQPNDYRVVECAPATGSHVYQFNAGAFIPAPPLKFPSRWTTRSTYRLSWNGALVDYARGGVARTDGTLRPFQPKWKGQASVALDYRIGQTGDPRSSYLIQSWVYPNSYASNSNWGGRCLKRGIRASAYNEVRLQEDRNGHWPDEGHDTTPGVSAGSDSRLPNSLSFPQSDPDAAPSHISNSGRYLSVGELGNIFDPAQWSDVAARRTSPNPDAGGGISLAIGRPEFPVFDRDGWRARHLTDLFSIYPAALRPAKGLINVNTAPREVLRSLWAGLLLDEDKALRRPILPPQREVAGDVFADAVIRARTERPLLGYSDLLALRDENGRFIFGDDDAWTSRTPQPGWSDFGREALFKRMTNLISFRSRAFRLVSVARLIETIGDQKRIIARAQREMRFAMQPRRQEDGAIQLDAEPEFMLIDRNL